MNTRLAVAGLCTLVIVLAGCGAVRVEPVPVLPPALLEPVPATIAVHFPAEFRAFVHEETRYGTDYEVSLGPAHVAELRRLLGSMFAQVVEVDDPQGVPRLEPPVRLVLEPHFEDYSFLTPRDMAGDMYTVTIRYRVNVYAPGGERVDGYVFTGYGRVLSGALAGSAPLLEATQRAMREAGAKLAVELPEEDTIRSLLAGRPVMPQRAARPAPREALGSFGDAPPVLSPPQEPGPEAPPSPDPAAGAAVEPVPEAPPQPQPPSQPGAGATPAMGRYDAGGSPSGSGSAGVSGATLAARSYQITVNR